MVAIYQTTGLVRLRINGCSCHKHTNQNGRPNEYNQAVHWEQKKRGEEEGGGKASVLPTESETLTEKKKKILNKT